MGGALVSVKGVRKWIGRRKNKQTKCLKRVRGDGGYGGEVIDR